MARTGKAVAQEVLDSGSQSQRDLGQRFGTEGIAYSRHPLHAGFIEGAPAAEERVESRKDLELLATAKVGNGAGPQGYNELRFAT